MNPKNLNLYIVDDDDAVRKSLGALLLAHLEECSIKTFESGESFLQNANIEGSGVVVLDKEMKPGMSGLDVHQELLRRKSPLVVLFLSSHGKLPDAVGAMSLGAVTWLEKGCSPEVLLASIEAAKAKAAGIAIKRRDSKDVLNRWNSLTSREKDVARHMRKGWANRLIADELNIGERTVETHRAKVYDKMWVSNPTELDRLMRDHGIDET
jgi:FixJ family two-component response regulator